MFPIQTFLDRFGALLEQLDALAEDCAVDAAEDYRIHYLGICRPRYRMLFLPEDGDFEVEIIDTWNMTVTPAGVHRGTTRVELPGNQYMAIRVKRV